MSRPVAGGPYDMLDAIGRHSAGLADAARDSMDAAVEHCPGWSVADLVWHPTELLDRFRALCLTG